MTPDEITRGLYRWLTDASRITDMPMGTRPCTWDELVVKDPRLAARWRLGIDLFLDTIGSLPDGDEHLNFTGSLIVEETLLASEDDPGEEHRITPDGG